MPEYPVLGILEIPTDTITALARVQFQDQKLEELGTTLQVQGNEMLNLQEDALARLYRPLTSDARNATQLQQQNLDRLSTYLIANGRAMNAANGVKVRTVASSLDPLYDVTNVRNQVAFNYEPTQAEWQEVWQQGRVARYLDNLYTPNGVVQLGEVPRLIQWSSYESARQSEANPTMASLGDAINTGTAIDQSETKTAIPVFTTATAPTNVGATTLAVPTATAPFGWKYTSAGCLERDYSQTLFSPAQVDPATVCGYTGPYDPLRGHPEWAGIPILPWPTPFPFASMAPTVDGKGLPVWTTDFASAGYDANTPFYLYWDTPGDATTGLGMGVATWYGYDPATHQALMNRANGKAVGPFAATDLSRCLNIGDRNCPNLGPKGSFTGTGIPPPILTIPPPTPPDGCPPCPPAEPPPTPPPPDSIPVQPFECLQLGITYDLYEVDTEGICIGLQRFVEETKAIQEKMIKLLEDAITLIDLDKIKEKADAIPYVGKMLRLMIEGFDPKNILKLLRCAIESAGKISKAFGVKDELGMIAVWTLRTFVSSFEDTSVGWELGPQVLLTLRMEFRTLKELLDYVGNWLLPSKLPGIADIDTLWRTNQITAKHAECLWNMHGESGKLRFQAVYGTRAQVSAIDLVSLWRRGDITSERFIQRLREQGWMNEDNIRELDQALQFMPPPSDLIRFAVRDVFDPNKLGREEMLEEFDQQKGLKEAFAAQGIGPIRIKNFDPPNGDIMNTGFAYWLASFEEVSPTQVYEMLHRLREDRVDRYRLPNPDGTVSTPEPVDITLVRKLLKEKDYNPIWRDRLAAISYRVMGRIDVRRVYDSGGFGTPLGIRGFRTFNDVLEPVGTAEVELMNQYLDQGYNEIDAILLAEFTAKEWDKRNTGKINKSAVSLVCQQYSLGLVNRETAMTELRLIGLNDQQANGELNICEFKHGITEAKKAIAAIRRQYLRGGIDAAGASNLLNRANITPDRIQSYLGLWAMELETKYKEVTAGVLCDWFGRGLVSIAEMEVRLNRMGYDPTDAKRIVNHCLIGIEAKRQSELNRLAKQQQAAIEKVARAQERARKEAVRTEREELRKFLALRSEKNLKDWFLADAISEDDIWRTFELRGHSEQDIERWIDAVLRAKESSNGEET